MKETMYELKTKDLKPDACQRCEIDRPDTASTGLPSCSHVSIKASQHRKILWHYAAKSFRKYQSLILSKIPLISLVPGTNEESAQRYPTIFKIHSRITLPSRTRSRKCTIPFRFHE